MEKTIITFQADEQNLVKTSGVECYASDTVSYIEAQFTLGTNWTGFDSVRAMWRFGSTVIATVLDSNGTCLVPHEVLTKRGELKVNLVGSIAEGDVLTDRLTTFPIIALIITKIAEVTGDETAEVTPSQFEQYVALTNAGASRAEASAEASEQSAQASSQSAQSASESAESASQSAESASQSAEEAEQASQSVLGLTATASVDSSVGTPSVAVTVETVGDHKVMDFDFHNLKGEQGEQGIQGEKGEQGERGETGASGADGFSPTVEVTPTTDGNEVTITDKDGEHTFEVKNGTVEDIYPFLPTDTAQGEIASFSDGANDVPVEDLTIQIEPIQSGSGDPSPTNVRPISGWTGAVVTDDPKYGGDIEWNQLIQNGNFESTGGWSGSGGTLSASNNELSYTFTNVYNNSYSNSIYATILPTMFKNHKYFVTIDVLPKYTSQLYFWTIDLNDSSVNTYYNVGGVTANIWNTVSAILSNNRGNPTTVQFAIYNTLGAGYQVGDVVKFRKAMVIDLTQMFGEGNEPTTVEEFKALFPKDYYEYNTGEETCVSAVNGDPYWQVPISWATEAGTVYGGTLDVTTGLLTVDRAMVRIADCTVFDGSTDTSGQHRYNIATLGIKRAEDSNVLGNLVCSSYPNITALKTYQRTLGASVSHNSDAVYIYDPDFATATVQDFKTAKGDAQLVYELATPQTYQLSATEVRTLLGDNNIWADTGSTEVTYRADIQKYIDKQISAVLNA